MNEVENKEDMSMNLDALNLKELKKLQNEVVKAISAYENRMKKEALTELKRQSSGNGL